MSYNIRNRAILKAAGLAIFVVMFCMVGCYDLGLEPSVETPTVETFVDFRDGKTYKKEQIGDQIWMAENLNFAEDGSVCYNNDDYNCKVYGRLYDWNTAMNGESSSSADPSGVEGVCPVGWHLPSDAEWKKLIDYVGINSGTKLKSHEFHRNSETYTPEGTDIYNFSALPGGAGSHHDGKTSFIHHGLNGYWWTATESESDEEKAWVRLIMDTQTEVLRNSLDKHVYFMSVRCVHD